MILDISEAFYRTRHRLTSSARDDFWILARVFECFWPNLSVFEGIYSILCDFVAIWAKLYRAFGTMDRLHVVSSTADVCFTELINVLHVMSDQNGISLDGKDFSTSQWFLYLNLQDGANCYDCLKKLNKDGDQSKHEVYTDFVRAKFQFFPTDFFEQE